MLNYKGLHATREHLLATDAQIDAQIERLLEQNMKIIQITDRPAQADDEVILDYAGECDGTFFEGGTAKAQPLTLGSGMFIPGFEEQLIGCGINQSRDVRVTFPAQYHAAELAGREAVFHCTIHEIHVKEKYAPDDVFASEVGGCESFARLRDSIRESLQSYIDAQADEEVREQLMNAVCEGFDYEIDPERLNAAVDQSIEGLKAQLARQNLTLEMYLRFTGSTEAKLREDAVPEAKKNLLRAAAVDEIARIENITADEDSMAEMIDAVMRENHMTKEELKPYLTDEFLSAIARGVVTNKVLDLIWKNAVIEEVEKG